MSSSDELIEGLNIEVGVIIEGVWSSVEGDDSGKSSSGDVKGDDVEVGVGVACSNDEIDIVFT